jgi:hypothetical protein
MVVSGIAVLILSVLTLAGLIVLGSSRWIAPAGRASLPDTSVVRPALVHFIMTSCHPGTAAFDAEIPGSDLKFEADVVSEVNGDLEISPWIARTG